MAAAATDGVAVEEQRIEDMRVADLRAELKQRSLDTSGVKRVLIARLKLAKEEEAASVDGNEDIAKPLQKTTTEFEDSNVEMAEGVSPNGDEENEEDEDAKDVQFELEKESSNKSTSDLQEEIQASDSVSNTGSRRSKRSSRTSSSVSSTVSAYLKNQAELAALVAQHELLQNKYALEEQKGQLEEQLRRCRGKSTSYRINPGRDVQGRASGDFIS